MPRIVAIHACVWIVIAFAAVLPELRADDGSDSQSQILELRKQNAAFQEQLRRQQELIESLIHTVEAIQETSGKRAKEEAASQSASSASNRVSGTFNPVMISGEGAAGLFHSGSDGMFSGTPFVVDEAKLFLESPIFQDVYFFGELNLKTRENPAFSLELGELYLDFENLSKLWNHEGMLNLRLGQMYIPFGEEYLDRYAIDNPLISHSLTDIWGVDEGVEVYGQLGKFRYAVAAQNGGRFTADFDSDKSVAGRLSFDPASWLHLSISGMRTGDLDATGDQLSALWFANGFFRSFGSGAATKFHANLAEADARIKWKRGYLSAFGGYVRYNDNDPTADNRRDIYYYSIEGVQNLTPKLYVATRFSQVFADKGFPIVGLGELNNFFFNKLTTQLWRLSLGLGYRFSPNLLAKAEYTFERGTELGGNRRGHEDFLGVEAAYKF